MLTLILGRAGSGKTTRVMGEIRDAVKACRSGQLLLVPEQYSHEAERELCAVCGDSLSLYGEVLSFTGLAAKVEAELGRRPRLLDKGGRLLAMALALDAVGARLKVYGAARRRPELQKSLLDAVTELKAARVGPDELETAAAHIHGALRDKLEDMALVLGGYDAVVTGGRADPADRLSLLERSLVRSAVGTEGHLYIDGFLDFTAQELGVIDALLQKRAELTVCLTCEGLETERGSFEPSRRTALRLLAMAKERGVPYCVEYLSGMAGGRSPALEFVEEHLLTYTSQRMEDPEGAVTLYRAADPTAECELAAALARRLVREHGCRYRDIAVAVRGFETYRPALESMFEYYGVPLFTAQRRNILQKPVPALIAAAFEIISGGWDCDAVLDYLKTGLTGLTEAESDALENYAFLWTLRGSAWTRESLRLHPDGYGGTFDEAAEARLRELDVLRLRIARPLLHLQQTGERAKTAVQQAAALADFMAEIALPERLRERAEELRALGREALAAEYVQLWDIIRTALEQCADILGGTPMGQEAFGRLFLLVLSQYDVGTIPVSLDRVSAGDMDRMRRRHIRHLIVLGASDDRLPQVEEGAGVFSSDDREALREQGVDIGGYAEDVLEREMGLIYNCLTLPGETLTVSCPERSVDGAETRPSFVINRLALLLDKTLLPVDREALRLEAPAPALELAAACIGGDQGAEKQAAHVWLQSRPEAAGRVGLLRKAAALCRGRLSAQSVRALYGERLRLSASRVDAFASCRFAYFLQYGLRAKPRRKAGFDPPELGSFMHFVLEGTARAVMAEGGFAAVSDERLDALTDVLVERYVHEKLDDFREKSGRFVYLFRRLTKTVRQVVADMAAELKGSDFTPLDFELDVSSLGELVLGRGEERLALTGIADRVDGWVHDGKLYLRVVDYKTGRKAFDLSDVWYGMGLQMLLYLFSLARTGEERYGREVVPAGVLYVPARDVLVKARGSMDDPEIQRERDKALRRSGLLLDDPAVLEAMEHGDAPRYLPVSFNKEGRAVGDSLASLERLGLLSRRIDETLLGLARELRGGSIEADPYFRSQQDMACLYCDYFDACHFDETKDCRRYLTRLKPGQVWERLEEGKDDA
jgi:ATP-dependent helicase/nuclease subunit B